MFKTLTASLFVGAVLIGATGCGVKGTWVLCDAQPVAARHWYTFNKVTLNPDSSFHAVGMIDHHVVKAAGTWKYCCCTEELTLFMGDRELVYKVRVPDDKKIRFMKKLEDGTDLAVTYMRQYPCPDCATCGPCDMMYRKYRPRPDEDFMITPAPRAGTSKVTLSASGCVCNDS